MGLFILGTRIDTLYGVQKYVGFNPLQWGFFLGTKMIWASRLAREYWFQSPSMGLFFRNWYPVGSEVFQSERFNPLQWGFFLGTPVHQPADSSSSVSVSIPFNGAFYLGTLPHLNVRYSWDQLVSIPFNGAFF